MASIFPCLTERRNGILPLLILCLAAGLPARADRIEIASGDIRVPVVELYTSEGCSSCPPADRWISKLGDALGDDLHAVPLAFHVDYWNYLGWEDPFSKPDYTGRQRLLGTLNRQRSIYTPGFFVSGRETRGTRAVLDAIRVANSEQADVHIRLGVDIADGGIVADLNVEGGADDSELYLAVYENDIVRQIGGGENHGRTLHHDFVVREFRRVGHVGGKEGIQPVVIPLHPDWNPGRLGVAAMVMDSRDSRTLQSVSTPLGQAEG
jgi:hypothetical protein